MRNYFWVDSVFTLKLFLRLIHYKWIISLHWLSVSVMHSALTQHVSSAGFKLDKPSSWFSQACVPVSVEFIFFRRKISQGKCQISTFCLFKRSKNCVAFRLIFSDIYIGACPMYTFYHLELIISLISFSTSGQITLRESDRITRERKKNLCTVINLTNALSNQENLHCIENLWMINFLYVFCNFKIFLGKKPLLNANHYICDFQQCTEK